MTGFVDRIFAFFAPRRPTPIAVDVPVVAVGSLSQGGTGKTPTTIALAQRLMAQGRAVHVIVGGEGAAHRVSERDDRAEDIGDEPLLIAAFAPTWVGADPVAITRAAIAAGAEVVVIDNGTPFARVTPDITILVEDAVKGFGNGRPAPFGPLKAALASGVSAADALITVGPKQAQRAFSQRWTYPNHPARLVPLQTGLDWNGMEVYAFAGIGVPERFFATLHDLGAKVVAKHPLTDHQELTPAILTRMAREAGALGAQMVTTEKDAVRLPPELRAQVLVLPVRLELDDWAPIDALLATLAYPSR